MLLGATSCLRTILLIICKRYTGTKNCTLTRNHTVGLKVSRGDGEGFVKKSPTYLHPQIVKKCNCYWEAHRITQNKLFIQMMWMQNSALDKSCGQERSLQWAVAVLCHWCVTREGLGHFSLLFSQGDAVRSSPGYQTPSKAQKDVCSERLESQKSSLQTTEASGCA